ncbi:MAG TPA: baseplate J/gp47 family protein [Ideonella sp.]|uniref:baseplate J/gp47 family protein n=1 Tax=Ideonella sp. TaxID=1929293 RepID=UPI002C56BC33|nr:baseplate J/gp47 family protein [Ideonella sp.]HSI51432.1 baseplate J/gp47 family protein [Ideonella sp.]
MTPDLTRWNRAGLSRFDYLDGNAAVWLERLRAGLAERFPDWPVLATLPAAPATAQARAAETEDARKQRLEKLYAADPDDLLWQLMRQFARASHVLDVHLDAHANEGYLGTASQWDSLRRLVAVLDYAPRPPASAATPLVLQLKAGQAGRVAAGLQVQHQPVDGAPLVFETLADLDADASFNTLYPRDHLRCPDWLAGSTLELDQAVDELKAGEPLVLEELQLGHLSAHRVEGLRPLPDGRSLVSISPPVPKTGKLHFAKGWTVVHLCPKDKLRPLEPVTRGVDEAGHSLQLAVSTGDLTPGDLVLIRAVDDKPRYRRVKGVHDDRLVFTQAVGALTLVGATVDRPIVVPMTDLGEPTRRRTIAEDGSVVLLVYAAGDWSRLASQWLSHIHKLKDAQGQEREVLPSYRCLHAKYVPVDTSRESLQPDDRPGYTALSMTWHADTDDVPGDANLELYNPQTLLAPPPGAGAWAVDAFLNPSDHGHLAPALVTSAVKQTAAGDLAVVLRAGQLAWTRLASVAADTEHQKATLTAQGAWQDRGGGPWFLSRSSVFAHFRRQAHLQGWQLNASPLSGPWLATETLPSGLPLRRSVVVDNGLISLQTQVIEIAADGSGLRLADPLPAGSTAGNLVLHANVVQAGHGESRPERVLGSGDATRNQQHFTLAVPDASFVADPLMSAGVRADLQVRVGEETWQAIGNLKDAGSTEARYQVRVDEDGHLGLQFGDGRHGRRLPSGANNVRVRFRQGVGLVGNLAPGSLRKLVKPHPLLEAVLQPVASSGGADRESSNDLRSHASATLLALDRAVSLDDFAQLARGHASVWQARSFRLPPGRGQRERIEVVVMAAGGEAPTPALQAELQDFLVARSLPGVSLGISGYVRQVFGLAITVRVRSAAFDPESVKAAVRGALVAAFSPQVRRLGQPLYRGEVYRVVETVTGVENADCSITLTAATRAALDRVVETEGALMLAAPTERQCLVLDVASLVVLHEEFSL